MMKLDLQRFGGRGKKSKRSGQNLRRETIRLHKVKGH